LVMQVDNILNSHLWVLLSPIPKLQHALLPSKCCELKNMLQIFFSIVSFYVATLALGLRPRRRLARAWAKRSVRECEDEDSHSQVSFHFGSWSPSGLPNLQRAIAKVKAPCIEKFFISLESYWSVYVYNGLAWTIWTSITQVMAKRKVGSQIDSLTPDHEMSGVKLIVWLPTTKCRESNW
jgi:hypothetical protein